MGGVLSSAVGAASLACQSAICCCNMANCCMSAGNGINGISIRKAKFFYVAMIGLATILALVLRYQGDALNINIGPWQVHCRDEDLQTNRGYSLYDSNPYIYCKGDAAVYRISFLLSAFFGFMTLSSLAGASFHRGWWGIKLFAITVGFVICFFIPNSFFDNTGWAWFARLGSVCFLSLQVLLLIDFAYRWNDSWVNKALDDDDDNFWPIAILSSATLLFLVAVVGFPLLVTYYGDCALGVGFSVVTFIGIMIATIITLLRDKIVGEDYEGAILPASVVGAYATYLCWSALESNPDDECKPEMAASSSVIQVVFGMTFAVISLCWSCFSVTSGLEGLVSGKNGAGDDIENEATIPLYTVQDSQGNERSVVVEDSDVGSVSDEQDERFLWIFHCTLFAASMYMAMVLTDWGADINSHNNADGHVGLASAWIKFFSGILTIGLYIWTLVAPRILKDRDF